MAFAHFCGHFLAASGAAAALAGLACASTLVRGPIAAIVEPPGEGTIGQQACPEGTIHDIQPQEAIVARLQGRDALIFVESCMEHGPAGETASFDLVLILSGPDVMGGTVAVTAMGECPVGSKFLGNMELIHAREMVQLFRRHEALKSVDHLDLETLTRLAEAGEPAAAFHLGFAEAMGWGTPRDRPGSIDWLGRAADAGYEPGMLALGMSLAGPGVMEEQLLPAGKQRPRDAQTDLVQACYWLRRLADAGHQYSPVATAVYRDEVEERMTAAERRSCKSQLKARRQ